MFHVCQEPSASCRTINQLFLFSLKVGVFFLIEVALWLLLVLLHRSGIFSSYIPSQILLSSFHFHFTVAFLLQIICSINLPQIPAMHERHSCSLLHPYNIFQRARTCLFNCRLWETELLCAVGWKQHTQTHTHTARGVWAARGVTERGGKWSPRIHADVAAGVLVLLKWFYSALISALVYVCIIYTVPLVCL